MPSSDAKTIGSAFAERARRTLCVTVLVASAVFAPLAHRVLQRRGAIAAIDRARLCAVTVASEPDGRILLAGKRLRDRYPSLLAVGVVGVAGDLESLYPQSASLHAAASSALSGRTGMAGTCVEVNGRRQPAWAVVVPVGGIDVGTARRVVFVLARRSFLFEWIAISAGFVLTAAGAAFLASRFQSRWFENQVVAPLQYLGCADTQDDIANTMAQPPHVARWVETAAIAERLHRSSAEIVGAKNRIKRLKRQGLDDVRACRTGLARKLRRAEDQATLDVLTGLRNRRFLEDAFEPLVDRCRKEGRQITVVMIDLDNFKSLNDTFGHETGDDVLRFAGGLIRASFRSEDIAIRYGGDEFLLVLPDVAPQRATAIVERIVKLFGQYARQFRHERAVTMSAGLSSLRLDGCRRGKELIALADTRLYHAKEGGKNGVAALGDRTPSRATTRPG